jgi:hypothetical protein
MVKKYPEGYFLGLGMIIGIILFSGFGLTLSIATGNPGLIGIGPAMGIAIGLAIGQSLEDKYKKEGKIRPLTKEEKTNHRRWMWIGIIALIIALTIFFAIIIFVR